MRLTILLLTITSYCLFAQDNAKILYVYNNSEVFAVFDTTINESIYTIKNHSESVSTYYLVMDPKCKQNRIQDYLLAEINYSNGSVVSYNGYTSNQRLFLTLKFEGIFITELRYHENNTVKYEIKYKNGLKHGICKEYFENGNTKALAYFVNGTIQNFSEFYQSGFTKCESFLTNGSGWCHFYSANGMLSRACFFEDYKLASQYFFSDGILFCKVSGQFKDIAFHQVNLENWPDLEEGKIQYFDPFGNMIKEIYQK